MVCLRGYEFEILLKNTTLQECENFIKDCSEDAYLVPGGYIVKGVTLLGTTSPVGFSGNSIIFRHTKSCFGFLHSNLKVKQKKSIGLGSNIRRIKT